MTATDEACKAPEHCKVCGSVDDPDLVDLVLAFVAVQEDLFATYYDEHALTTVPQSWRDAYVAMHRRAVDDCRDVAGIGPPAKARDGKAPGPAVVDAFYEILEKHSKDSDGAFLAGDRVRCAIVVDLVTLWRHGAAPSVGAESQEKTR